MQLQLGPQQDTALCRVRDWLNGPDQMFYLAGYAGTGKTTLAQIIAEGVGGLVLYAAYTGKAALRLRQKGCVGASTCHSFIYTPKDRSRARLQELEEELGQMRHEIRMELPPDARDDAHVDSTKAVIELKKKILAEKENAQRPFFSLNSDSPLRGAKLLIVDENSFLDEQITNDLLSFGCKILFLGDPGQLPPVGGKGFFVNRKPDFMLTEIHRQAANNPIIRMATIVREGGNLQPGDYGASRVIPRSAVNSDMALAADQLLCGKNITRQACNRRHRVLLGRKDILPECGDRLVCLRNNHNIGLLNGAIWTVENAIAEPDFMQMLIKPEDEGAVLDVKAWKQPFLTTNTDIAWYERNEAEEFDYGYALTVHKAQGSEWGNVLLFDEWFNRDTRKQWLYTGLTRAAEKITVVQM